MHSVNAVYYDTGHTSILVLLSNRSLIILSWDNESGTLAAIRHNETSTVKAATFTNGSGFILQYGLFDILRSHDTT